MGKIESTSAFNLTCRFWFARRYPICVTVDQVDQGLDYLSLVEANDFIYLSVPGSHYNGPLFQPWLPTSTSLTSFENDKRYLECDA